MNALKDDTFYTRSNLKKKLVSTSLSCRFKALFFCILLFKLLHKLNFEM